MGFVFHKNLSILSAHALLAFLWREFKKRFGKFPKNYPSSYIVKSIGTNIATSENSDDYSMMQGHRLDRSHCCMSCPLAPR
jgi:hypothetical protein